MKDEKSKLNQYVGRKFGRLTILEIVRYENDPQRRLFKCQCDCGMIKEIYSSSILKTNCPTISCGCYNADKSRKEAGHAGLTKVYNTYRSNAKARDIKFELTIDEFKDVVLRNCHYCGTKPGTVGKGNYRKDASQKSIEHANFIYSGIDRVDSNKDYSKDNIVPCCKACNLAKHEMSSEEFESWILNAADFLKQKIR